jgi:hypothetical protein
MNPEQPIWLSSSLGVRGVGGSGHHLGWSASGPVHSVSSIWRDVCSCSRLTVGSPRSGVRCGGWASVTIRRPSDATRGGIYRPRPRWDLKELAGPDDAATTERLTSRTAAARLLSRAAARLAEVKAASERAQAKAQRTPWAPSGLDPTSRPRCSVVFKDVGSDDRERENMSR